MANPRFVHLRFHSEYSIIDGMVRIDPIIEKVLEHGGVALGIADIMNLFGGYLGDPRIFEIEAVEYC